MSKPNIFIRIIRNISFQWNTSRKHKHIAQAFMWVLYLGVPIMVYKLSTPESIYWLKYKVGLGAKETDLENPMTIINNEKVRRDRRAKERDERIKNRLKENVEQIESPKT